MRSPTEAPAAPLLAIVVPCFNEEAVLPATARELLALLAQAREAGAIDRESFVCFVDDGSRDRTWSIIEALAGAGEPVTGIGLSRNRGHQNALLAGLFTVQADAVITLDADLQDDPRAILRMLSAHRDGAEIVYGVRARRDSDSWFKRVSARAFYRVLSACGVDTVHDHADYRLMSRRAIDALRQFGEVNLYLRGLVPLLGLRTATVEYDRGPRHAGVSKYPLGRMLGLALDAITSFSVVPLRWITIAGFLIFLGSLTIAAWVLWARLATDAAVPGWASVTLPIFVLGGIQMLGIGVLGEYLGKIYIESKSRPRYFIERLAGDPRALSRSPSRSLEAPLGPLRV